MYGRIGFSTTSMTSRASLSSFLIYSLETQEVKEHSQDHAISDGHRPG